MKAEVSQQDLSMSNLLHVSSEFNSILAIKGVVPNKCHVSNEDNVAKMLM